MTAIQEMDPGFLERPWGHLTSSPSWWGLEGPQERLVNLKIGALGLTRRFLTMMAEEVTLRMAGH